MNKVGEMGMEMLSNAGVASSNPEMDESASLGAGLAMLLDELAYGVAVIRTDRRLLHANQAARHELGRQRVLGLRQHLVTTLFAEDGMVLHEAVARAAAGKRSMITLTGQGTALTLVVLPLNSEGASRPHSIALVFARATVCDSLMLGFFARSHGLTRTEEQVLDILCQGFSAPDAAVQLNVAVSTIRSHVRSLCAKTRSSGVRELVNRVAVLPPVGPALWREPMH
jgi:DNA-binding CsgD family transcriptional regulator